jgi:hypothetical protein
VSLFGNVSLEKQGVGRRRVAIIRVFS